MRAIIATGLVKQYKKMFDMDGINLVFDDEAIRAVAKKAMKLKTGARGLRTILEESMLSLMYSAPGDKTIDSIVLGSSFIENGAEPKYVRKNISSTEDKTA